MRLISALAYAPLILASALPQSPFLSQSDVKPTIISPTLRARIEALRTKYDIPGITIGLAASPDYTAKRFGEHAAEVEAEADGWTLETAGFGIADRYENAVDGDTLFCIASNSKLFTALSVGLLVRNNTMLPNGQVLDWVTKIKDILPEWKLWDEYASDHVDLMDLLCEFQSAQTPADVVAMRSGLPRHDPSFILTHPRNVVAKMRYLKPSTELRKAYQYNNLHYITLAYMIEVLSGLRLDEYAQKHMFDPLNMTSTFYNATLAKESGRRSDGFVRTAMNMTKCAEQWLGNQQFDKDCFGHAASIGWWTDSDAVYDAGPGGVIISANDAAKWVKELLDPSVLPAELIAKTTIGLSIPDGQRSWPEVGIVNYGLGQQSSIYRGHTVYAHTGSVPGQISVHRRFPDAGFGFYVATNDQDLGTLLYEVLGNTIVDDLLGLEPIDWEGRVLNKTVSHQPDYPSPPEHPRPPTMELVGTYTHKAYGEMNVKLAPPNATEILHAPLNVTGPIYVASVGASEFFAQLYFTHFDGPVYNYTVTWAGTTFDKRDHKSHLVRTGQVGTAVFAEEGLGMFGDWWGSGSTVPSSVVSEVDVEKHAEVWYEKM